MIQQKTTIAGQTIIRPPDNVDQIKKAFKETGKTAKLYSKWFHGRKSPLELTIIAPVYHNPAEREATAYKKLFNFMKMISRDPTILDKASGMDLSRMFKRIHFVPFKLGTEDDKRYVAVYEKRYHDKEILNDILRVYDENGKSINSMELSIRIDPVDLKKNIYSLSGYKTVKEPGLKRNSYYYNLSKSGADGELDKDIINAIVSVLTLSIPEYVSIDRKGVTGKIVRIITDNPDGTFTGRVYKLEKKERFDKLEKERKKGLSALLSKNISLKGHRASITSVAISADSRYAVTGSIDNSVKLWDIAAGKEIRTFTGHSSGVLSVAIDPAGNTALSGSYDGTLKLWDMNTGQIIRTIDGHNDYVYSVSFSPSGKYILSGSADQTLKLWDVQTGNEIKTFKGHKGDVRSIAFTPDEKYVISGSGDKTVKLWDIETGKEIRSYEGHKWNVISVAASPDGKYIISGSDDSTLILWDIKTGKLIKTFQGHKLSVLSVAFSPDSRYILSGSSDNTLKLWDIAEGKEIGAFSGNDRRITATGFSPDGTYALSGSEDNSLKLLKLEDFEKINTTYGRLKKSISLTKYQSRQVLFTAPVSQTDVNRLMRSGYLRGDMDSGRFNSKAAQEITNIFKLSLPDEFLSTSLIDLYADKLNKTNFDLEGTEYIGKALHIISGKEQKERELYPVSRMSMEDLGFKKMVELTLQTLGTTQEGAVQDLQGGDASKAFASDGQNKEKLMSITSGEY